ncbi:alpha-2C adrenergic receptor-like [Phlebotomus argentipes]|uniref:alpha-2C adrenergic receptor-like n=1 Tax=Phlebotomus argentipes TaxID=94469 RepID=UPI002892E00A|nr:alpha-2C adrenergic receptor-like [Phlebotomus argentipes]XP_059609882.1 alpha-2C adrenergic receptor-like [Phlebotomus argentipes]XP_059609883.1 alpha-2C adrenergic receptor-like [Phlebotomus argentipes]
MELLHQVNLTMADDFLSMVNASSSTILYAALATSSANISGNATFFAVLPSKYSLAHIVIASIVVTILMVIIVVGNMLVIIAIATEKSLKGIQNWFIASLAVADFFLGLVIMPFSLANELMGYWIFGAWWCDIHSAMDVLLCTASIMNLCLISLDRYWSITKAVEYLKTRTPARAAVMIASVWIMSGVICIPPLLGWKAKRPEGRALPQCQLSQDVGYVLYSALGSFYIPSCIMVFVYIRIYYAAKRRARRGIKKPSRNSDEQTTNFISSVTYNTRPMPTVPECSSPHLIATIESHQPSGDKQIPVVTCDLASESSNKDTTSLADAENQLGDAGALREPSTIHLQVLPMIRHTTNGMSAIALQSTAPMRCRAFSVGIDSDMVSEFDPSSSDSGVASRCSSVKPSKFRLFHPIFGRRYPLRTDVSAVQNATELEPVITKGEKKRDPEKEKRRLARKKEKRATLILGLIMGCFIACWLPFFFLYILIPTCDRCKIPDTAFAIAFWLGYMNSAFNPVIYTIFNKDFRRAFRRILFK